MIGVILIFNLYGDNYYIILKVLIDLFRLAVTIVLSLFILKKSCMNYDMLCYANISNTGDCYDNMHTAICARLTISNNDEIFSRKYLHIM